MVATPGHLMLVVVQCKPGNGCIHALIAITLKWKSLLFLSPCCGLGVSIYLYIVSELLEGRWLVRLALFLFMRVCLTSQCMQHTHGVHNVQCVYYAVCVFSFPMVNFMTTHRSETIALYCTHTHI